MHPPTTMAPLCQLHPEAGTTGGRSRLARRCTPQPLTVPGTREVFKGAARQAPPAPQAGPPALAADTGPPSGHTARRAGAGARSGGSQAGAERTQRGLWRLAGLDFPAEAGAVPCPRRDPKPWGRRSCWASLCRGRRRGPSIGLSFRGSDSAQPPGLRPGSGRPTARVCLHSVAASRQLPGKRKGGWGVPGPPRGFSPALCPKSTVLLSPGRPPASSGSAAPTTVSLIPPGRRRTTAVGRAVFRGHRLRGAD